LALTYHLAAVALMRSREEQFSQFVVEFEEGVVTQEASSLSGEQRLRAQTAARDLVENCCSGG